MEFTAVIIFLVLYFIHPQDWVPGLEGANVIKPVMALGFWGLISREKRKPAWEFMKTPHEWVMVTYLLYGIYCDPDWWGTFMAMLPLASFYFLTAQALNTEDRLDRFFRWWAGCVIAICLIGVAADMGIDLTNARDLIAGQLGRLCLNTSLLDNPNAMGHTAVTAFPLIYYTMVFRRGLGGRVIAVSLTLLVVLCVASTESKGAYLSGAAGIAATLLVGRTVMVQMILIAILFLGGSAATTMLPRMATTGEMQYDEGVQGRAMAFEAGRASYETATVGWDRFMAEIRWEGELVAKSTHSSLVQVGADLGPIGLFLYVSIMGCACRAVLTIKTESDDLERCRGMLFPLFVGYFVSGWMINRSYHTEFFLMTGATVAFHKLARESIRRNAGLKLDDEEEDDEEQAKPLLSLSDPDKPGGLAIELKSEVNPAAKLWMRYGLVDLAVGYGLLYFTEWFWDYLIDYFLPNR